MFLFFALRVTTNVSLMALVHYFGFLFVHFCFLTTHWLGDFWRHVASIDFILGFQSKKAFNTFTCHIFCKHTHTHTETMYHLLSTSQLCVTLCWSFTRNPNKIHLCLWKHNQITWTWKQSEDKKENERDDISGLDFIWAVPFSNTTLKGRNRRLTCASNYPSVICIRARGAGKCICIFQICHFHCSSQLGATFCSLSTWNSNVDKLKPLYVEPEATFDF